MEWSNPRATVPYAELLCHSNFSFLDGASHPEELAEEAARLKLEALALTDHDGLYGVVRFAEAAGALGLPTVFGAEVSLERTRPGNGVADPEGAHKDSLINRNTFTNIANSGVAVIANRTPRRITVDSNEFINCPTGVRIIGDCCVVSNNYFHDAAKPSSGFGSKAGPIVGTLPFSVSSWSLTFSARSSFSSGLIGTWINPARAQASLLARAGRQAASRAGERVRGRGAGSADANSGGAWPPLASLIRSHSGTASCGLKQAAEASIRPT